MGQCQSDSRDANAHAEPLKASSQPQRSDSNAPPKEVVNVRNLKSSPTKDGTSAPAPVRTPKASNASNGKAVLLDEHHESPSENTVATLPETPSSLTSPTLIDESPRLFSPDQNIPVIVEEHEAEDDSASGASRQQSPVQQEPYLNEGTDGVDVTEPTILQLQSQPSGQSGKGKNLAESASRSEAMGNGDVEERNKKMEKKDKKELFNEIDERWPDSGASSPSRKKAPASTSPFSIRSDVPIKTPPATTSESPVTSSETPLESSSRYAIRPPPALPRTNRRQKAKLPNRLPTNPSSIVHHPQNPDALASTPTASVDQKVSPEPPKQVAAALDFHWKKAPGSVNPLTISHYKKLQVQIKLAEHYKKKKKLEAKREERHKDLREYEELWGQFEDLRTRAEIGGAESPSNDGSSSFALQNTSSWYVNFEAFDDELDEGESLVSLLSSSGSTERQRKDVAKAKKNKYASLLTTVGTDISPSIQRLNSASVESGDENGGDRMNYASMTAALGDTALSEDNAVSPASKSPVKKQIRTATRKLLPLSRFQKGDELIVTDDGHDEEGALSNGISRALSSSSTEDGDDDVGEGASVLSIPMALHENVDKEETSSHTSENEDNDTDSSVCGNSESDATFDTLDSMIGHNYSPLHDDVKSNHEGTPNDDDEHSVRYPWQEGGFELGVDKSPWRSPSRAPLHDIMEETDVICQTGSADQSESTMTTLGDDDTNYRELHATRSSDRSESSQSQDEENDYNVPHRLRSRHSSSSISRQHGATTEKLASPPDANPSFASSSPARAVGKSRLFDSLCAEDDTRGIGSVSTPDRKDRVRLIREAILSGNADACLELTNSLVAEDMAMLEEKLTKPKPAPTPGKNMDDERLRTDGDDHIDSMLRNAEHQEAT